MALDYSAIKKAAEGYKADMVRFLRAMISHPSESCEEKEVVACIRAEMEKLGFDRVEVDGLGNVIGWMGRARKSSPSIPISIPSASETGTTGPRIPMKATKPTKSSTAAAAPIRRAAWPAPFTARRS